MNFHKHTTHLEEMINQAGIKISLVLFPKVLFLHKVLDTLYLEDTVEVALELLVSH